MKSLLQHCIGTVIVLILAVMVMDYLRLFQEYETFKQTHQKETALINQIKDIRVSLSQIDSILNRINKFSSKLSVIASLPNPVNAIPVASVALPEQVSLDAIQEKIQLLKMEAKIQEKSLSQLGEEFIEHPELLASVPSLFPVKGRISSSFGFRKKPNGEWQMHEGMDIAGYYGSAVIAPAGGIVEEVAYSPGYGNYLVVDHGFGLKSIFAHTSKILVKTGDLVKRGAQIARVGSTGRTRGVHLHYEVKRNGAPVDPADFILNEG